MAEYISDYQSWGSRLMFTQMNARLVNEPDTYNKVIILLIVNLKTLIKLMPITTCITKI